MHHYPYLSYITRIIIFDSPALTPCYIFPPCLKFMMGANKKPDVVNNSSTTRIWRFFKLALWCKNQTFSWSRILNTEFFELGRTTFIGASITVVSLKIHRPLLVTSKTHPFGTTRDLDFLAVEEAEHWMKR